MTPTANKEIIGKSLEFITENSKTYLINQVKDNKVRIKNKTDGIDAVKQAIYLILSIERYNYIMFSWNYGVELTDLFGREKQYVIPELERRIREALIQDDRISDVNDFRFSINRNEYTVTFNAKTIFGEVDIKKVVDL